MPLVDTGFLFVFIRVASWFVLLVRKGPTTKLHKPSLNLFALRAQCGRDARDPVVSN
jgi:hypothetical protein